MPIPIHTRKEDWERVGCVHGRNKCNILTFYGKCCIKWRFRIHAASCYLERGTGKMPIKKVANVVGKMTEVQKEQKDDKRKKGKKEKDVSNKEALEKKPIAS